MIKGGNQHRGLPISGARCYDAPRRMSLPCNDLSLYLKIEQRIACWRSPMSCNAVHTCTGILQGFCFASDMALTIISTVANSYRMREHPNLKATSDLAQQCRNPMTSKLNSAQMARSFMRSEQPWPFSLWGFVRAGSGLTRSFSLSRFPARSGGKELLYMFTRGAAVADPMLLSLRVSSGVSTALANLRHETFHGHRSIESWL